MPTAMIAPSPVSYQPQHLSPDRVAGNPCVVYDRASSFTDYGKRPARVDAVIEAIKLCGGIFTGDAVYGQECGKLGSPRPLFRKAWKLAKSLNAYLVLLEHTRHLHPRSYDAQTNQFADPTSEDYRELFEEMGGGVQVADVVPPSLPVRTIAELKWQSKATNTNRSPLFNDPKSACYVLVQRNVKNHRLYGDEPARNYGYKQIICDLWKRYRVKYSEDQLKRFAARYLLRDDTPGNTLTTALWLYDFDYRMAYGKGISPEVLPLRLPTECPSILLEAGEWWERFI